MSRCALCLGPSDCRGSPPTCSVIGSCCEGVECSGIPGSQPEPMGGLRECVGAWSGGGRGGLEPPLLSLQYSLCSLSLHRSLSLPPPFSPTRATVRTGEGHIAQLISLCALLPGGVSQFLLISFPRVPISQIKALSLPSFVLHLVRCCNCY